MRDDTSSEVGSEDVHGFRGRGPRGGCSGTTWLRLEKSIRAFSIRRRVNDIAKDDCVIELKIIGPDELGTGKVMFKKRLLGSHFLLRVFLGIRPLAVIKMDRKPIIGDQLSSHARLLGISINGPKEYDLAFHRAFVTVPSPSFKQKPPSPMFVLAYSIPVTGSALSFAITAIVIG